MGLAVVKGQRPAAEQLGIPVVTLHQWFHSPEFERIRTTAREEVADQVWATAQVGVGEMLTSLQDAKTPLRDKTDAVSMLIEKYQLLTGHATNRQESRDITEKLAPEARDALMDEIDTWLAERSG